MNYLKKLGYDIVVRTAGSHSLIDIIAFNAKEKEIKVFQVKKHRRLVDREKSKELGRIARECGAHSYDVYAADKEERYALKFICTSKLKGDI